METLSERAALALKLSGKTAADVAREIESTPSYVSRLVRGERANPGHKYVYRLAVALGVSPEWLSTGEGDMAARGITRLAAQLHQGALEEALQGIEWPGDYDVAEAAALVAELRREALTPGADELPAKFWIARLKKKFSQRKA